MAITYGPDNSQESILAQLSTGRVQANSDNSSSNSGSHTVLGTMSRSIQSASAPKTPVK